jgi:hypothetical protein
MGIALLVEGSIVGGGGTRGVVDARTENVVGIATVGDDTVRDIFMGV